MNDTVREESSSGSLHPLLHDAAISGMAMVAAIATISDLTSDLRLDVLPFVVGVVAGAGVVYFFRGTEAGARYTNAFRDTSLITAAAVTVAGILLFGGVVIWLPISTLQASVLLLGFTLSSTVTPLAMYVFFVR
jgi:hypothetical protein